jgi:hypothetical protein
MRPGQLVADDDPVIKGREHLFEDVDAFMERQTPRVEQATAEPGARRSLTRPKKQAAAKKAAAKKTAAKPPAEPATKAEPTAEQGGGTQEQEQNPATEQGSTDGTGGA